MVLWDWGVDDLQERYTENLVEKIIILLNNQWNLTCHKKLIWSNLKITIDLLIYNI